MRRDRPQPKSKKYQQWVSNIINRNEQNNETTIDGTTNLFENFISKQPVFGQRGQNSRGLFKKQRDHDAIGYKYFTNVLMSSVTFCFSLFVGGGGGGRGGGGRGGVITLSPSRKAVPYHFQSQVINVSKLICFYKRLSDQNHSDLDV